MQNLSRRTVLAAMSAPVAAATIASSLAHAATQTPKSTGGSLAQTDWRGIPLSSELKRKSVRS